MGQCGMLLCVERNNSDAVQLQGSGPLRATLLSDFLLQKIERNSDAANSSRKNPLNLQIYRIIREAILAHLLEAGIQLPSSRELARELRVSRNTITFAYEQLIAEGYLEARPGSGTFITDTIPDQIPDSLASPPLKPDLPHKYGLSPRGENLIKRAGVSDPRWGAFTTGTPDVTQFPNKIWSRLQNKVWYRSRSELLTYGPRGGHLPLREAIADYLSVSRSVNCSAKQVLITTGVHQSIDLAVKLLGQSGDQAWVEDPVYWGTRSVLDSLGIEQVPITVDAEGMQMNHPHLHKPPRFIFVTPSHQYPLGAVMSLARRRMLLEYAAAHHVWILEDDYDSEFRYGSRPLASLQGLDKSNRVLYTGTFSKTMFPGLRIGFLVVPEPLADPLAIGLSELYRGGQIFTQAMLAEFMRKGHFGSHIRRMRVLYAERLGILQEAIQHHFAGKAGVIDGEAGLHLVLGLPDNCDDQAISSHARIEGIITRPLSSYYANASIARRGLLLGYSCVPSEQIRPAFDKLAGIIKQHWPKFEKTLSNGPD